MHKYACASNAVFLYVFKLGREESCCLKNGGNFLGFVHQNIE